MQLVCGQMSPQNYTNYVKSMLWNRNSAQYSCDFETLREVWVLHEGQKIKWQLPAVATNRKHH